MCVRVCVCVCVCLGLGVSPKLLTTETTENTFEQNDSVVVTDVTSIALPASRYAHFNRSP